MLGWTTSDGAPRKPLTGAIIPFWVRGLSFGNRFEVALVGRYGVLSVRFVLGSHRWGTGRGWLPTRFFNGTDSYQGFTGDLKPLPNIDALRVKGVDPHHTRCSVHCLYALKNRESGMHCALSA